MPNPFEGHPHFVCWWEEAESSARARNRCAHAEYGDSYAALGLEGIAYRILEKGFRLRELCKKDAPLADILDTVLDLHVLGQLAHAWIIGEEAKDDSIPCPKQISQGKSWTI